MVNMRCAGIDVLYVNMNNAIHFRRVRINLKKSLDTFESQTLAQECLDHHKSANLVFSISSSSIYIQLLAGRNRGYVW